MKHVWWWYLFPWVGIARMTEAYEDALVIVREQSMELHKLRLETAGLWRMVRKLGSRVAPVREVVARYGINAPCSDEEIVRECPPTLEEGR